MVTRTDKRTVRHSYQIANWKYQSLLS